MSTKPRTYENLALRAELNRRRPAELEAIDLEVANLRRVRGDKAAQLDAIGYTGAGADELHDDLAALDEALDARRQERDDKRLAYREELEALIAPHLQNTAPALIEAARLIQSVADDLSEIDRFLNSNSPPWAAGGYYGSLPSPDRLMALADSFTAKGRQK